MRRWLTLGELLRSGPSAAVWPCAATPSPASRKFTRQERRHIAIQNLFWHRALQSSGIRSNFRSPPYGGEFRSAVRTRVAIPQHTAGAHPHLSIVTRFLG